MFLSRCDALSWIHHHFAYTCISPFLLALQRKLIHSRCIIRCVRLMSRYRTYVDGILITSWKYTCCSTDLPTYFCNQHNHAEKRRSWFDRRERDAIEIFKFAFSTAMEIRGGLACRRLGVLQLTPVGWQWMEAKADRYMPSIHRQRSTRHRLTQKGSLPYELSDTGPHGSAEMAQSDNIYCSSRRAWY